jgi:hypothetical protein
MNKNSDIVMIGKVILGAFIASIFIIRICQLITEDIKYVQLEQDNNNNNVIMRIYDSKKDIYGSTLYTIETNKNKDELRKTLDKIWKEKKGEVFHGYNNITNEKTDYEIRRTKIYFEINITDQYKTVFDEYEHIYIFMDSMKNALNKSLKFQEGE